MNVFVQQAQNIKIIAELIVPIVIRMNIVVRNNINNKLEIPASEIGYYPYSTRYFFMISLIMSLICSNSIESSLFVII